MACALVSFDQEHTPSLLTVTAYEWATTLRGEVRNVGAEVCARGRLHHPRHRRCCTDRSASHGPHDVAQFMRERGPRGHEG
jgi:hypothetical protein